MNSDDEQAFEDQVDGSDWQVPPKPDAASIAELRAKLTEERERCARHCEILAHFMENGAGPLDEPGFRLRQAARKIRQGDPAKLWSEDFAKDPKYRIPEQETCTPKPSHVCELDGTPTVAIPTCPKCGEEYLDEYGARAAEARETRRRDDPAALFAEAAEEVITLHKKDDSGSLRRPGGPGEGPVGGVHAPKLASHHDEALPAGAAETPRCSTGSGSDADGRYLGDGLPLDPEIAAALIIKMVEQTGARVLPEEHRRYIRDVCAVLVSRENGEKES